MTACSTGGRAEVDLPRIVVGRVDDAKTFRFVLERRVRIQGIAPDRVVSGVDDAVVVVVAGESRWRRDDAQHALAVEERSVPRERGIEVRQGEHVEGAGLRAGPIEHVERCAFGRHVAIEQIDFEQAADERCCRSTISLSKLAAEARSIDSTPSVFCV